MSARTPRACRSITSSGFAADNVDRVAGGVEDVRMAGQLEQQRPGRDVPCRPDSVPLTSDQRRDGAILRLQEIGRHGRGQPATATTGAGLWTQVPFR